MWELGLWIEGCFVGIFGVFFVGWRGIEFGGECRGEEV